MTNLATIQESGSTKKIVFIHRYRQSASFRYRVNIPAKFLDCQINGGEADIVVFSKPCEKDLELLELVKNQYIIVDICDDHFLHPQLGPLYKKFIQRADQVICPTKFMQELIRFEGKEAKIIPDPYEFDEVEPHAKGNNYLWFGHHANIQDVAPILKWKGLRIVTGPTNLNTIPYSRENLLETMRISNIAVFPTSKPYKSPNRLVNALRQGLFPICSPHPSYEEFKDMCWVGPLLAGKQWANHFQDDLNELVREGQDYIREKFSPETVGKQWKDLFDSI